MPEWNGGATMKKTFYAVLLLSLLVGGGTSIAGSGDQRAWPEIQPVKRSFHLVDRQTMGAKLQIVSTKGTPLYLLECYINAYDREDPDFDYSGDIECRLTSLYSKEAYSTLLTEEKHPTRDWQSRGRLFVEDISGKCAAYPEYGKVRHFKLRGMNLTLEIKNFKVKAGSSAENAPWNRDRINELDLEVTVAADAAATSEIAAPTKYLEPPLAHPNADLSRKCDKVLTK